MNSFSSLNTPASPVAPARASHVKRGFTLIELLVVIAIIAILASILFPVFGRARENARKSSCLSNEKQIGLGIMQYSQDYDECYPLYSTTTNGGMTELDPDPNGIYGWADGIQPYLKSEQIYQCPSDPAAPPQGATLAQRARKQGFTDYVYNCALSRPPGSGRPTGVSQATLEQASLSVMLVDGNLSGAKSTQNGSARNASRGSQRIAALATDPAIAAVRHLEGANILFCDGHVKWQKAGTPTTFASVYNCNTPFSNVDPDPANNPNGLQSGNNPTFHLYGNPRTDPFPAPDAP